MIILNYKYFQKNPILKLYFLIHIDVYRLNRYKQTHTLDQTLCGTNCYGKILKHCTPNLTNGEDAANVLAAVALRLEVADSNDVVLYQAVVANVIVNGRDLDQLRAHFCIGSDSWKKEARVLQASLVTTWTGRDRRLTVPAVYSAFVKRGVWSLMSSSSIWTSSRLGSRAGSKALVRPDL